MNARLDLARLALSHGQGKRVDVDVPLDSLRLGGETYAPKPDPVSARLDVSHTATGFALRLRFTVALEGPCVRCLERAAPQISIDAREVDQTGAEDEEMRSPYVEGVELDISRWAFDALVLAAPAKPLCREDCAGLCPGCGVSLNDADPADHQHGAQRDPRWAKLDELK